MSARRDRICKALLIAWLALALVSNAARTQRDSWTAEAPLPDGVLSVRVPEVGAAQRGTNTVRVAYREWPGEGEGPVVLFVHDSPGSGQDFEPVAQALPGRLRRLAVDLPGSGASSRALPDHSAQAHARYLLRLLDALGIGRVHLVGHGLGGAAAIEAVGLRPERVLSLTLLSAVGVSELGPQGDHERGRALHGLRLAATHAALLALPHFGALDEHPLGLPHARRLYQADLRPLRDTLRRIGAPVKLLHGRLDEAVPVEAALEHHRIVPHSELHLWEDLGHEALSARPGEVAEALADFIDRVEAGTARTIAEATREEVERAALPFDPQALAPRAWANAGLLGATLALCAAASADAAAATAGLLVAYGQLPWLAAAGSLFVGLFLGDLLSVLFGRAIGRQGLAWLEQRPLSWLVRPGDIERAATSLARHGPAVAGLARFVPGSRFAVCVTAGMLEAPPLPFALWLAGASALWSLLGVGVATLLGQAIAGRLDGGEPVVGLLLVLGLALLLRWGLSLLLARARAPAPEAP